MKCMLHDLKELLFQQWYYGYVKFPHSWERSCSLKQLGMKCHVYNILGNGFTQLKPMWQDDNNINLKDMFMGGHSTILSFFYV